MKKQDKLLAQKIYLILGSLFITSLVVSNLIFQKFFYWHPFEINIFGERLFELSVGILPYPITFLITDILSEIYGKKLTNMVVISGFVASLFVLLFLWLGAQPNSINMVTISNLNNTDIFAKRLVDNSAAPPAKYSSFSSILSSLVIFLISFWENNFELNSYLFITFVIILYTHRQNIVRLKNKTEDKIKL